MDKLQKFHIQFLHETLWIDIDTLNFTLLLEQSNVVLSQHLT